jgi:iron complex transport system substrate-binding protein
MRLRRNLHNCGYRVDMEHIQSLYQVDKKLLRELKPNLILTQNLCQVCAPSGNELAVALKSLQPRPEVLWMSPHSLEEIHAVSLV